MSTEQGTQQQQAVQEQPVVQAAPASFLALEGMEMPENLQKELNEFAAQSNTQAQQNLENPAQNNEPAQNDTADDQKNGEQNPQQQVTEDSEKKVPEKKNVFGIGKKQDKKIDVVVENAEQALEVIKSKFGQEIKDIKEIPKFFEAAEKWRADSQKVAQFEQYNQNLKSILENLPDEFLDAIDAHYKGEDYMKVFENKPKFDFNVPAEKQDVKQLVNHYFPGKFTDEDFTEEEKSPALEIAISASQDKFNVEKQTRDNQRAATAQNAQKQLEAVKASVGGSVAYLKQSFPDIEPAELKSVQSTLEGGPNAVVQMFFNNDGTVKQNAAEALMMAVHGKSVIDEMVKEAAITSAHSAETRVHEEILSRGNDTRKPKHNNGTTTQISDAAQRTLDSLKGLTERKTF